MKPLHADVAAQLVEVNADDRTRGRVMSALLSTGALLSGHFALHRARHATRALRFRGIGRDPAALALIVDALLDRMPAPLRSSLPAAKVLTAENAGFFLGHELARRTGKPPAVAQTDLRRLPTTALLSGEIETNEPVALVTDVFGTGASIEALSELVAQRGGRLSSIIVFGLTHHDAFREHCEHLRVAAHWLVKAHWASHAPGPGCPGCEANEPLTPIAELA